MKYLSFDIEATGLEEHDLIIEFACVPFDTNTGLLSEDLSFHHYVKCPPFEQLKPKLNPWVIEHNKELIEKASIQGLSIIDFKKHLKDYLTSQKVKDYFSSSSTNKVTLFGKSMAAIDLPFMNRDLSWDFMREHFEHRQLDLSSVAYNLIDMGILPKECQSGSFLMNHLGFGSVAHTALEDAVNTAKMYLKILAEYKK
jgi:DNA polymerase III epsilon subunit-like protein